MRTSQKIENNDSLVVARMLVFVKVSERVKARSLRSLTLRCSCRRPLPRCCPAREGSQIKRCGSMWGGKPIVFLTKSGQGRRGQEFLRGAKRGAFFLMEQGGGERAERIEWVSLVVDVAVCSHFAGFIASMLVFINCSLTWNFELHGCICQKPNPNLVVVGVVDLVG